MSITGAISYPKKYFEDQFSGSSPLGFSDNELHQGQPYFIAHQDVKTHLNIKDANEIPYDLSDKKSNPTAKDFINGEIILTNEALEKHQEAENQEPMTKKLARICHEIVYLSYYFPFINIGIPNLNYTSKKI